MDEGKTSALLKWVNSVEIGEPINSLQQLSSGCLLLKILCNIDKDYQIDGVKLHNEKSNDLHKVLSYLDNFYQQSITSFISQNEIIHKNVLEIGKVLSLLLYCAIQGDEASVVVENITNMNEDMQLQLKIVIEAVLKEVNCEKINMTNITNVLDIQSGSGREPLEWENGDYQSSPIATVTSPVLQLNSPIKALMASPQMQSRQSQATISKLYKKLNQLQMKINTQQLTQSNLEHELEEKTQQTERQDLKMSSVLKEAAKIRGLEDEIQSLYCCEKELTDVKSECERLKRRIQELQNYKQQFLKLEIDFSGYVSEKSLEKAALENQLKKIEKRSQERILSLESSLEEENLNNRRLRVRLLEMSSGEAAMKEKMNKIKEAYDFELEKLKMSLDESSRREDELRQKKGQEVIRQITRENELKNCFKEKETNLKETVDQLELQNMSLRREKEILRKKLEYDLDNKQLELTNFVRKYESLQTDFNSLECECKSTRDKLVEENNSLKMVFQKSEAEANVVKDSLSKKDAEWNELKVANETLTIENTQMFEKNAAEVADLHEEKTKESLLLKEARMSIKKLEDELRGANDILVEGKRLAKVETDSFLTTLSSKDEEISKFSGKSEKLKNDFEKKEQELQRLETLIKEKEDEILQEHNKKEELVENSRRLVANIEVEKEGKAVTSRECEKLQNSLKVLEEEKALLMKDNVSLTEKVKELDILSKECEYVQICFKSSCEEKESLMTENEALRAEIKQINLEAGHNKQTVGALLKENQIFKSTLAAAVSTLNTLRGELKETRNLFWIQKEEITTMHADFKDGHEKLVNQHTRCKQILCEKERNLRPTESEKKVIQAQLENVMKAVQDNANQAKIIEKKDAEMERSRKEAAIIHEENKKLNEIHERNEREYLKEQGIAENAKRQLADSENEIKKLKEEALRLKFESQEEAMKLNKKMELIQEENCRFKEQSSMVEEVANDLDKKLVEEEFISRRLGIEVRSLEAQLSFAERLLHQKQTTEETDMEHKDKDKSQIREISAKLYVSENSVVSEAKLEECSTNMDMLDQENPDETKNDVPPSGKREPNGGLQNSSALFQIGSKEVKSGEDIIIRKNSAELDVSEKSMVCETNVEECGEKSEMIGEKSQDREHSEVTLRDHKIGEPSGRLRRRSALYQTKVSNEMSMNEKRRSTVGGTFFVVDEFTLSQDEPESFDYDWSRIQSDWGRIQELRRRNATCLPHMRSSYPVETQVRAEEEVREEELKSGHLISCTSRKRLRENASDSNLSVTFHIPNDTKARNYRGLPKSKSDNLIGLENCRKSKRLSEKVENKLDSLKLKIADENSNRLSSSVSLDQSACSDNNERFARRESVAFSVDLSPPKKSRSTFKRSIHRSFGKSDLSLSEKNKTVKNNRKATSRDAKKILLPRKPASFVKSNKKPLAPANQSIK